LHAARLLDRIVQGVLERIDTTAARTRDVKPDTSMLKALFFTPLDPLARVCVSPQRGCSSSSSSAGPPLHPLVYMDEDVDAKALVALLHSDPSGVLLMLLLKATQDLQPAGVCGSPAHILDLSVLPDGCTRADGVLRAAMEMIDRVTSYYLARRRPLERRRHLQA
jgi:hypothetical protein